MAVGAVLLGPAWAMEPAAATDDLGSTCKVPTGYYAAESPYTCRFQCNTLQSVGVAMDGRGGIEASCPGAAAACVTHESMADLAPYRCGVLTEGSPSSSVEGVCRAVGLVLGARCGMMSAQPVTPRA